MKRAVVSQRVDGFPDRQEIRDGLDRRLTDLLLAVGCLAYPMPNRLGDRCLDWLTAVQPDLIILSGGNNLGDCQDRDATERALLTYALEQALPVLGLCRGMQMMADYAGTSLHPVTGHVGIRHDLFGKIHRKVNSYHTFSVDGCPHGYEVLAWGLDREIEAIRHRSLPWEGWMWHPERERPFEPADLTRLLSLIGD